jgi:hypothetical protein
MHMPATPTRGYIRGEEGTEKGGSVLSSRVFNITFTLGKFHLMIREVRRCLRWWSRMGCGFRNRSRVYREEPQEVGAP